MAHTKVTGGRTLAAEAIGNPRNVTTKPALTLNQSVFGTLVEIGMSGLTPTESARLAQLEGIEGGLGHADLMKLVSAA